MESSSFSENPTETDESEEDNKDEKPMMFDAKPGSSSEKGRQFGGQFKRKEIRKVFDDKRLAGETIKAQQEEFQRQEWIKQAAIQSGLGDIITLGDVDQPSLKKESASTDVICLSSDEETEETAKVAEDQKAKKRLLDFTNDRLNIPDAEGRMLINIGHATNDPDVFLAQHLVQFVKPHQLGGIRFLYSNVIESIDKYRSTAGFGCILAHSMGLGKTLQVIAFSEVVQRCVGLHRVMIVVPINTLQNWVNEFERWLPKGGVEEANVPCRPFDVFVLNDNLKTLRSRADMIEMWYNAGGVLLLGYEIFRLLTSDKSQKKKTAKIGEFPTNLQFPTDNNTSADPTITENQEKMAQIRRWLCDPGPDLIVCDEGHKIKNLNASTSRALNNIRTRRRVVLTGYPLQNSLTEYFCMVNFVRPQYLGTRKQFSNMFERPIMNGNCVDSTANDVRLMRFRTHVLTQLLSGFVQRRTHSILHHMLPEKREFVLFVRKSPVQHWLYRRFMQWCQTELEANDTAALNPLKAFAVCCKVWNHPDILYKFVRSKGNLRDLDLDIIAEGEQVEEDLGETAGKKKRKYVKKTADCPIREINTAANQSNFIDPMPNCSQFGTQKPPGGAIDYSWADDILANYSTGNLNNGFKFALAFSIIDHSVMRGDKILLFSQSLLTLDLLEEYLAKRIVSGTTETWRKNRNYFRLDGSTSAIEREKLISRFNCERNVFLFLISTRAGSLGINLTGANRVLVLDASWNPCHDAQAVCRVYRYGQQKPVHVYRLVTDNSMERAIFNRQVGKQGISERVVDQRQVETAMSEIEIYDLMRYDESQDLVQTDWQPDFSGLKDEVLLTTCNTLKECLAKEPVPHESLLLDKSELYQLSEKEKREAKRSYDRDLRIINGGFWEPHDIHTVTAQSANSRHKQSGYGSAANFPGFQPSAQLMFNRSPSVAVVRPMPQSTPLPMSISPNPPGIGQSHWPTASQYGHSANNFNSAQQSAHNSAQFKSAVKHLVIHTGVTLPSVSYPGHKYMLTPGTKVISVRTAKGFYLRTLDGHVLDGANSLYDSHSTADPIGFGPSHSASQSDLAGMSHSSSFAGGNMRLESNFNLGYMVRSNSTGFEFPPEFPDGSGPSGRAEFSLNPEIIELDSD